MTLLSVVCVFVCFYAISIRYISAEVPVVVVEAYALIYNRREKLKGMKVWVFVCAAARGEGGP